MTRRAWRWLRRHAPTIRAYDSWLDVVVKAMGVIAFCALAGWWLRVFVLAAGGMP